MSTVRLLGVEEEEFNSSPQMKLGFIRALQQTMQHNNNLLVSISNLLAVEPATVRVRKLQSGDAIDVSFEVSVTSSNNETIIPGDIFDEAVSALTDAIMSNALTDEINEQLTQLGVSTFIVVDDTEFQPPTTFSVSTILISGGDSDLGGGDLTSGVAGSVAEILVILVLLMLVILAAMKHQERKKVSERTSEREKRGRT